ncbi:hypothetical protein D5F01_LYC04391 [Larimichthys crocea]|uniref:ZP domain-containing protein n=1 Tax=Larimichthys crocea TaxID=215358 RepID=A0A6G0J227_LARCR|nr:hypothetical protein D5F01_LYC04391 [Larimichthys crocea]
MVSLLFLRAVDSHHAPSCLDGDYLPLFLPPTPRNGVNLPAFVNRTLEIRVRATARSYVYQSKLRCVVADVAHHNTVVYCSRSMMKVEVEKSFLIKRHEKKLHLKEYSDAACSLKKHSNNTHLVAIMSLNTCGTTLEEIGDNLVFENEISSAEPKQMVSRQDDVEISFSCIFPKRTNLTLGFRHKNPYAFLEKGFGYFTYQFEFYETELFRKALDPSTYPVEVNLKQMIFMQIEAITTIPTQECSWRPAGQLHMTTQTLASATPSLKMVSGTNLNLGTNLMLIGTCFVVCVGVVIHLRRSKAKYQLLPSVETD